MLAASHTREHCFPPGVNQAKVDSGDSRMSLEKELRGCTQMGGAASTLHSQVD